MKLTDAIRFSGANLHRNPVRTLLTILGLGVGIGAILTVITLGMAGERQVKAEIARLGVDKVWLTAAEGAAPLSARSGEIIAASAGLEACADALAAAQISFDGQTVPSAVCGYDRGFASVYSPVVTEGRLFTAREYSTGAPVALVDQTLADAFDRPLVGRYVDAGNRQVRVVGVVTPLTAGISGAGGMLILPLNTFLDTYPAAVNQVTINIGRNGSADATGAAAMAALGGGEESFRATSMAEEIEAVEQVVRIFVMVLACVAAVCMLTGSIGVMNILLVSVRERRREIGLMKAIGGTAGQVGLLFLLEAVCYALLGGLLGLLLGMAMIRWFGAWIGLSAALSWQVAAPTFLLAGLLGVLFGVGPALRAAGMLPVDALRQES